MIEAIIFALFIGIGGFLVVAIGEHCRAHTVDVSCSCGRCRRTIYYVESADAKRLADLLTDECPGCRQHRRACDQPEPAPSGGITT